MRGHLLIEANEDGVAVGCKMTCTGLERVFIIGETAKALSMTPLELLKASVTLMESGFCSDMESDPDEEPEE